jgi:UDP-glucose 4-epimerase
MHKKIGFIGQGWIGKNYADNFEQRGYNVVRYAKEEPYDKNRDEIAACDIVYIAVPTPSTPQGFDFETVRQVIKLVGPKKIAVIKSTVYPGTTEILQAENPDIFVLHSPEFLTEATAAHDAANPTRNIVGIPIDNMEYREKARDVIATLPYAPYQLICSAREAEIIKYGGNNWFYFKVVYINMLYDLARRLGAQWEVIRDGMAADPRIGRTHLDPIHKSGRGAGGHCFIKDFAAFAYAYEKNVGDDEIGTKLLEVLRDKNVDLLLSTNKDLDLLAGVYGEELIANPPSRRVKDAPQGNNKGPKCLVTGGAGFIGSNLVDELVRLNCEVIIIDNLLTGKKENINPAAKFYELDIRDLEKIKPHFAGVDYVFHLAAMPRVQQSIDDPVLTNDINLNGTLNVLVAARDAKVKKVVYSASSSAYGMQTEMPLREDMRPSPMSPYGVQKWVGEQYCRMFSEVYGLPTVSLRYFNIYGKRQALEGAYALVMGIFARQRLAGEPMSITGDGEQRRDFTYVGDAVRANIMAAKSEKTGKGEVINIGRGKNYSVNELAKIIGGPVVYLPPRIEPRETLADNSKARELLGWEPRGELPEWIEGYKKEIGLD